jgi:holo-[acyl-carrier protein] synthase
MTDPIEPHRSSSRLDMRLAFYHDLTAYLLVNAGLVAIWALSGAGNFWPIWPMLGWGIGIGIHASKLYYSHKSVRSSAIEKVSHPQGIGCDLVDVSRIREVFAIKKRWKNVFSEKECAYFERHQDPWPVIAGHFAAKEAVSKALGTGFSSGIGFLDIEIDHLESGAPLVVLSPKVQTLFPQSRILLSISHEKNMAVAFAMRTCE